MRSQILRIAAGTNQIAFSAAVDQISILRHGRIVYFSGSRVFEDDFLIINSIDDDDAIEEARYEMHEKLIHYIEQSMQPHWKIKELLEDEEDWRFKVVDAEDVIAEEGYYIPAQNRTETKSKL